jgi:hypothetical protein
VEVLTTVLSIGAGIRLDVLKRTVSVGAGQGSGSAGQAYLGYVVTDLVTKESLLT